jgi:hypothetical protein
VDVFFEKLDAFATWDWYCNITPADTAIKMIRAIVVLIIPSE